MTFSRHKIINIYNFLSVSDFSALGEQCNLRNWFRYFCRRKQI